MKKLHPVLTFRNNEEENEFSDFIKDMLNTKDFPYTKFQVDSNCCSDDVPWFFEHYGHHVSELVLSFNKDHCGEYSLNSKNLQFIMRKIVNVEELELNCLPRDLTEWPLFRSGKHAEAEQKLLRLKVLRFTEEHEMGYSVGFLQPLFYIAPNCSKIVLNTRFDPTTISRFFTSMKIVSERPAFVNLEIHHRMRERQIQLFNRIGFHLKHLKLENIELLDEAQSLRTLLESQSQSLETLYLCARMQPNVQPEEMPVMSKLVQLSFYFPLHARLGHDATFPLVQDSSRNQFPRLNTLRTTSEVFNGLFATSKFSYSSVESLNIKIMDCNEASLVQKISKVFPQLKCLWILFSFIRSGNGIPTIFGSMERLEQLRLEYSGFGNINNFICGSTNTGTKLSDSQNGDYSSSKVPKRLSGSCSVRNMKREYK
jgi:hypothetical protein